MNPSDSLRLDDYLARLLATYDQGIGGGDADAPTVDLSPPADIFPTPLPGERVLAALSGDGSLSDLLPDSKPGGAYPADPRAPFVPPTGVHRIGRFELRRQLGKGGCGIVFLAYDPKLKREVAVKIPRPEMLASDDARRRLAREARAAAEFDHPNLVPVYETGEIGPVCYIATAYCPGQTLADWLDRQSFPVPARQAARLVAQLAEAIQHAHERGVLHRDLKPNNVILQETKADPADQGPPPGSCALCGDHFVPRVVDFGLAKLDDHGPAETVSRQVLGTPKYMAPEQAQARRDDVGPAADGYALGVILYEMLAGRVPYDGATDIEVLRLAIEGNLTPPRTLRPDLPRDLEAICLKAMARSVGKRYRTAIDLADDLRRFLDGRPTVARPLNRLARAARTLRRHDQFVALAVVTGVAIFLLTLGVLYAYENRLLRTDRDQVRAEQTDRARADRQRDYSRHVREAFLSWRAGDAHQMADSLARGRATAAQNLEKPGFAWGYLAQLGRVERLSVACPAGAAAALAVSPDGTRVATGHPDGTVALWDRRGGAALGSVKGHPAGVTHLAFVLGGAGLVSAGGEPTARLWGIPETGGPVPVAVLPALAAPVTALAASPGGALVYVGSGAGECLCWAVTLRRPVKAWAATQGEPVVAVAVSPDGATVATVGQTDGVRLWDAATGGPGGEIRGAGGATALAFAPAAGGWLLAAAARDDGTVRLFDRHAREVRTLHGHAGTTHTLAASPDGSAVAAGGGDGSVCVWDVPTGSPRALLRGHDQPVRGVGFGADGTCLVTGSDDARVKVWDLTADPEGGSLRGLPAAVTAVAAHPDGRGFAVAYADGAIDVYADRAAAPRRVPADGRGPVGWLCFPEAGGPVGVEMAGRAAVVWDFGAAPRRVLTAEVPGGSVATAADLSPAAGRVAVGNDRGRVAVWSLDDGRPVGGFDTGLAAPVRHLGLSADGTRVAAPTAGHAVGVWAVGDDHPTGKLAGHGDGLWLVRFLPGGERVVTAGRGSSIKVWVVANGREEATLLGHVGRVTGVTVSPDGRTLVSGSGTGEVKLWDVRTGQELVGLRRHSGPVTAAAFSGDGRTLFTGGLSPGGRGELAFWDALRE